MLPRVEYIEWIHGRPERATHDLATSDLRVSEAGAGRVVPPVLEGVDDPPEDVTLGAQVAEAYGVEEDQVEVTAGATHAYVLAVAAALDLAGGDDEGETGDAGDRVAVELPGYEPLRRTPEAMGATLDRFRRPADEGYPLAPERVAGVSVEDTALVVATNRHNPSGRLTDAGTLADAAGAARDAGTRLLVDEVYAPYTATAADGAFGGPTAAGVDGAVVTGSLTKFHGLGGLRIGWVVADEDFLDGVRKAFAYLPVRAEPSVALGRRALASRERIATRARERIRANHDLLASFVDGRPDLSGPVDVGSPFAFLEHDTADGDEVAEAAWERDLLVVPGRFFEDDGGFRVSLGGDPGRMAAGLDVLRRTLDAL